MPRLTVVFPDGKTKYVDFDGNPRLFDLLSAQDIPVEHPCGGRGVCGKCRVEIEGHLSPPTAEEERAGGRLSCRTRLLGDARLVLGGSGEMDVEFYTRRLSSARSDDGYGLALDIGTTTLALQIVRLSTGEVVGRASDRNPQTTLAADVMGRIRAATEGQAQILRSSLLAAVRDMTKEACRQAGVSPAAPREAVVTGNTVMLHLLCGRPVDALGHAPFAARWLFDETVDLEGVPAYLPPCMDAFVGADVSCAVLSSGLCRHRCALLADVGTNGEIALFRDGKLYVTSTAAGPAFEGAGISCGMNNVPGAVTRVTLSQGELRLATVGGAPPRGVCGSGLLDAISVFLKTGLISGSGATLGPLTLAPGLSLTPQDVRALQLAKAAVAAGMTTLLETAGVGWEEVERLYLAGGFGSHFSVSSAVDVGLLPPGIADRVSVIGNAALAGATMLLLDPARKDEIRRLADSAVSVRLSGHPAFSEHYMDAIAFFEE